MGSFPNLLLKWQWGQFFLIQKRSVAHYQVLKHEAILGASVISHVKAHLFDAVFHS